MTRSLFVSMFVMGLPLALAAQAQAVQGGQHLFAPLDQVADEETRAVVLDITGMT